MSAANELEQQMLVLINDERTQAGLDPLKFNGDLNTSAEDHSEWMIASNTFSHTGDKGSSATERMADAGYDFSGAWTSGENIAFQSLRGAPGLSDDVVDLHNGLMNSPGHRANILNPDFKEIGIGIEAGEYSSGGTNFDSVFVTQNFAKSDASTGDDDAPEPSPTPPVSVPDPEPMAELDPAPTPEPVTPVADPQPDPVTPSDAEPQPAQAPDPVPASQDDGAREDMFVFSPFTGDDAETAWMTLFNRLPWAQNSGDTQSDAPDWVWAWDVADNAAFSPMTCALDWG